jgi:hypothetical protein
MDRARDGLAARGLIFSTRDGLLTRGWAKQISKATQSIPARPFFCDALD